ncbi:lipopolysaccharide biosynthesis protein RfbH [Scatolibacter rhodanostii]|uniref:lipopolysaccharide biosynthesis protein RfbH n=1 Tax=Scatolibacter rhodanostii TaxID=2014781 RepID=UPI001FA90179|nr:lipopolysaccharide biosynthesis protein RfbH [Scatolibacter rhodanostii]
MFEQMSQSEAKEAVLQLVEEYWSQFHQAKDTEEPERIPYSGRVYDSAEMKNLVDSALDFWLTAGEYTEQFESGLAEYIGVSFCSVVNSGSSANLLAFMALTSPLLKARRVLPGDEIITVAACFPTTLAPVIQYGAIPVFIDITIPEYNINISQLEQALTNKTKAVMIAHTLGNPFDLGAVKDFCDKNNLWLIEDNCDALGSEYYLDKIWRKTGSVGDIGTSSFYPPHHITMGEGGAVYTKNPLLHKIIRSLRDWGRDCICNSGQDNRCGHRFSKQYGKLPMGYDHKYVYSHFGYNLKATDMQAAIGVAQLEKLPKFVLRRRDNFDYLKERLQAYEDFLMLPEPCPNSLPSWFGFLVTCKNGVSRNTLIAHLEDRGIQTRMLFAGNILRHPCFEGLEDGVDYRVATPLVNTDRTLYDTFWVGVYPGMTNKQLDKMADEIILAIKKQGMAI